MLRLIVRNNTYSCLGDLVDNWGPVWVKSIPIGHLVVFEHKVCRVMRLYHHQLHAMP